MAHNPRNNRRDNRVNGIGKDKTTKTLKTLHAPVVTREPNAERTARLEAAGGRHNIEAYANPQTRVMFFGTGAVVATSRIRA